MSIPAYESDDALRTVVIKKLFGPPQTNHQLDYHSWRLLKMISARDIWPVRTERNRQTASRIRR